ncbi:MAG: hypothetical protein ABR907_02355 [Terracidiphilus sp.]|jgi:hypothetical protein
MVDYEHNPAEYSRTLGLAGRAFSFNTNSFRILDLAGAFFSPRPDEKSHRLEAVITLLVRNRRGVTGVTSNFPLFRGRNEFVHADYGLDGSVWFDLKAREVVGALSDQIIADEGFFRRAVLAVIAGILAPSLGVIVLHAGCVVREGKAILLAAPSGVGKSTLSLSLATRGWSLLSDDWSFVADVANGLIVWGMQTTIKLLPDAALHFPKLLALTPAIALNGELSFEIDPWTYFGVERSTQVAPSAIVFLNRDSSRINEHGCDISYSTKEGTMDALLDDIEEQPEEIVRGAGSRKAIMHQLCCLPSLQVRFCGEPAAVAADLDQVLTELIYA